MQQQSAQLLVSVRNSREAKTALMAGVGIIDAKNPDAGSLGRCDAQTWQAISGTVKNRVPMSAALGEWHEWQSIDDEQLAHMMDSLSGYHYAKIGPEKSIGANLRHWRETFERLRAAGPTDLKWIAVIYADTDLAESLDRHVILEHAAELGLHGILIDTWSKKRAWSWNQSWADFCRLVKSQQLQLALAGSLNGPKIRQIGAGRADWFAVRGAACIDGQRTARISYRKTSQLVKLVNQMK